jgi:hypothetical protein
MREFHGQLIEIFYNNRYFYPKRLYSKDILTPKSMLLTHIHPLKSN